VKEVQPQVGSNECVVLGAAMFGGHVKRAPCLASPMWRAARGAVSQIAIPGSTSVTLSVICTYRIPCQAEVHQPERSKRMQQNPEIEHISNRLAEKQDNE